jgi:hypothetical protein
MKPLALCIAGVALAGCTAPTSLDGTSPVYVNTCLIICSSEVAIESITNSDGASGGGQTQTESESAALPGAE